MTSIVCSDPPRRTVTATLSPGLLSSIAAATSFGAGHVLTVDLDDDVARLQAGIGGRAVRRGLTDLGALAVLRVAGLEPEVGVLRSVAALERRQDLLDGVHRDRERDADVALAATGGGDLRVDADDLAVAVEQRTAGVAGVDRRVGLDDAVDREAVRRRDLALEAGTMPAVAVRSSPSG